MAASTNPKPTEPEEQGKFLLRLSPALKAELTSWAAAEFRSLNGQIEYLLHNAVEGRKGKKP